MSRPKSFRSSDISRAVRAAEKVGRRVSRVEIDQDGNIALTYLADTTVDDDGVDLVALMRDENGKKAWRSRAD
jgi:hypothetical protein